MPAIYQHPHQVESAEIDAFGHANNLCYLQWCLSAAEGHSAAQGWSMERYLERGLVWVVRNHQIRYLRPALSDEELVVETWVATMERYSSLRRYRILRGDQVLARAETDWVFVTLATGAPRVIPEEVGSAFEVVEGRR